MVDWLQVTDRLGDARRCRCTRQDNFHPATAVGPDDCRLKIVLHCIEGATGLGLRREVGDRAVVRLKGVRGDSHHGENDHHHDRRCDHDFDQGKAAASGTEEGGFHRLMMMFCTRRGVSSRTLKIVELT